MTSYFGLYCAPRGWKHQLVWQVSETRYARSKLGACGVTEYPMTEATLEAQIAVEARGEEYSLVPHQLGPARRHPRINRGECVLLDDREAVALQHGTVATSILIDRLRRVFDHVEPDPKNGRVWGHVIRELLILAATEFETAAASVLRANGVPERRFSTIDYVRLLDPMHLDGRGARLALYPAWPLVRPFEGWSAENPTASLRWYDAYNRVKHDRERNFHLATLEAAIHATVAAVLMLVAQFGRGKCEPILNEIEPELGRPFAAHEHYYPHGDPNVWELVPAFAPEAG